MPRCTHPCTVRGSTLVKRAKSSISRNSICLSSSRPRGPDLICRYIALPPTPRNALTRALTRSLRPEGLLTPPLIGCGPSSRLDCPPSSTSSIRLSLRLMWHHSLFGCGTSAESFTVIRLALHHRAIEPSHTRPSYPLLPASIPEQHYSVKMVFVYTFIWVIRVVRTSL